jgi:2',3'-cyclic-nucleotide 2'-phosphodiesterase
VSEAFTALMIGDVVGGVGLRALLAHLPELIAEYRPDLVVVNAENAADGSGTSPRQADELFAAGANVLTGGNHTLRRASYLEVLRTNPRVLRPANLPQADAPGTGLAVVDTPAGAAAVINLQGAVFMDACAGPFAIVDELVTAAARDTPRIFVDFHAEATSEKVALGQYLDGRVTAVVGTHTHVQTADERVLARGSAYITDLGMTGPHDSVIGVKTTTIVNRFLTGAPGRFEPADGGVRVQGAVITASTDGRATTIRRIDRPHS